AEAGAREGLSTRIQKGVLMKFGVFIALAASLALCQSGLENKSPNSITLHRPPALSPEQYADFLRRVEQRLPEWQRILLSVDPGKDPNMAYATGKMIDDQKRLGLMEIENIRTFIAKEREHHTVSHELGLMGFMDSLNDTVTIIADLGGTMDVNWESYYKSY